MKRASDGVPCFDAYSSERSVRRCIERSMWLALDMPTAVLMESFTPELQSAFAGRRTSIEMLVTKAQEQAAELPTLDSMLLDVPAAAVDSNVQPAEAADLESPNSTMSLSLSLPGLARQKSFCPSVLTENATSEQADSTRRCVGAIARLARRCGALPAPPAADHSE
mmetsp:Transcript_33763/g.88839  ORF Transcript_33763/g.88839 Transcript_33763/m.88839 type:complete len:166 (-) Transcript_33763:350-847(-)